MSELAALASEEAEVDSAPQTDKRTVIVGTGETVEVAGMTVTVVKVRHHRQGGGPARNRVVLEFEYEIPVDTEHAVPNSDETDENNEPDDD